jgi:hypothetical protein
MKYVKTLHWRRVMSELTDRLRTVIPSEELLTEAADYIDQLVEAIESYTGHCPEFKTLEPCLSEDCLMFRRALAGLEVGDG